VELYTKILGSKATEYAADAHTAAEEAAAAAQLAADNAANREKVKEEGRPEFTDCQAAYIYTCRCKRHSNEAKNARIEAFTTAADGNAAAAQTAAETAKEAAIQASNDYDAVAKIASASGVEWNTNLETKAAKSVAEAKTAADEAAAAPLLAKYTVNCLDYYEQANQARIEAVENAVDGSAPVAQTAAETAKEAANHALYDANAATEIASTFGVEWETSLATNATKYAANAKTAADGAVDAALLAKNAVVCVDYYEQAIIACTDAVKYASDGNVAAAQTAAETAKRAANNATNDADAVAKIASASGVEWETAIARKATKNAENARTAADEAAKAAVLAAESAIPSQEELLTFLNKYEDRTNEQHIIEMDITKTTSKNCSELMENIFFRDVKPNDKIALSAILNGIVIKFKTGSNDNEEDIEISPRFFWKVYGCKK
jgi:SWI/SNF-related matrix-associated actin-dependent regulator 1 of chromatin subfamily A